MSTAAAQAYNAQSDWGDDDDATTSSTYLDQDATSPTVDNGVMDDLIKPRRRESSFASVVSDLAVGESASKTYPVPHNVTLGELNEHISKAKATLRNNAQPAMVAARKRTNGQYRIETGETITQAGNLYLLVIITRTE